MIKGLDLFSGIGGISLALFDIIKPLAYVEIDPFCQKVLKKNIKLGKLHKAPIFNDVREFKGSILSEKPDIIYGGFPCQDISVAGHGKGLEGERSGLFFEITRIAKETKAPFIFLENVPAIRTRGLLDVTIELTQLGYDIRWTTLPASHVGAHHIRQRFFLLAYSERSGLQRQGHRAVGKKKKVPELTSNDATLADSDGGKIRIQQRRLARSKGQKTPNYMDRSFWFSEPNVDRVANGISERVERVKALGNAVVPLQVRFAFDKLMGFRL